MKVSNLILCGALLGLVTFFGVRGIEIRESKTPRIVVEGQADRHIEADFAVWRVEITTEDDSIKKALKEVKEQEAIVAKFLQDLGFTAEEMKIRDNLSIKDISDGFVKLGDLGKFPRFKVVDTIKIESKNLALAKKAYPKLMKLMEEGIHISGGIDYICKDIDKLKLNMVKEAVQNAHVQAENIANASNVQIKRVEKFSAPVFSISDENSEATDNYGNGWKYSESPILNKRVRVTLSGTFSVY